MKQLPKGLMIYELRAKHGRKHVVLDRWFVQEHHGFHYRPGVNAPTGPVRWYIRRRGERFKPLGDWFSYYPLRKNKS